LASALRPFTNDDKNVAVAAVAPNNVRRSIISHPPPEVGSKRKGYDAIMTLCRTKIKEIGILDVVRTPRLA
jgi:hypothetical protein